MVRGANGTIPSSWGGSHDTAKRKCLCGQRPGKSLPCELIDEIHTGEKIARNLQDEVSHLSESKTNRRGEYRLLTGRKTSFMKSKTNVRRTECERKGGEQAALRAMGGCSPSF